MTPRHAAALFFLILWTLCACTLSYDRGYSAGVKTSQQTWFDTGYMRGAQDLVDRMMHESRPKGRPFKP